uniref:hypothetical protein n=1 Tax=Pseudomonas sp. EL_65y_Pfl2_R96 TaxID=3088699 RepID=UPI0030DA5932
MSDKIFRGNRGLTGMVFMALVTVATIVYWLNPPGNPMVDMISLGGSVAASAMMGYTVDYFGWDGGFILLVVACLLAMAFLAPTLGHKNVASQGREALA